MRNEPYRDDDYVWRCQHGKKLHLACDDCKDCQSDEASDDGRLRDMLVMLAMSGMGMAVMFALGLYLLF